MNLLGHLFNASTQKWLKQLQNCRIASKLVKIFVGPRKPIGLNHVALIKMLFGQNLVRQIAVLVSDGVLNACLIQISSLSLQPQHILTIK